ncbi:TolC family protein [Kerstersia sp.]|uniref:TolC family protein n=1 Tax=Kerstersia sp. TaxID=1930783 RepID=UPI003F8D9A31
MRPVFRYSDVSVFSRRCCVALVSASLAGCLAVQVPDLPDQTPLSWSEPPAPQHAEVSLTHGWQAFDDPQLDALVEQVLRQNLDLQQAALRLRGEQAVAERWQGAFLPNLSANARPLQDVAAQDSYFHASIEMSWELGLFGAAENAELKAMADVGYAKSSYDAVMVAVVADVVRNYLDLGVARAQMALLAQTEALEQQAVRLARIRQQYHLGEQDELTQLLQQQQRARAAYAEMRGTADRAARGLALLLGQDTPDPAWQAIGQAPVLAPFSLAQVPADLLRTRPDIRSAEAEVMHAAPSWKPVWPWGWIVTLISWPGSAKNWRARASCYGPKPGAHWLSLPCSRRWAARPYRRRKRADDCLGAQNPDL